MSAEARMLARIEAAVREATAPLERAVEEMSARLAALEGADGQPAADAPKKPARGRTPRAKAQAAEVTAITGDGVRTEPADYSSETAVDEPVDVSEKVPEQRKGTAK